MFLLRVAPAGPRPPIPPTPPPAPPPPTQTIVEIAAANPDFSTLVTALNAASLVNALSGPGPFTVFAPTNEAFAALPTGVLANLLKPENKAQLVDLLTYHVVPAGGLNFKHNMPPRSFKTVEGKNLTVTWRKETGGNRLYYYYVEGVRFSNKQVAASNGGIFPIGSVLTLPPPVKNKTIVDIAAATPDLSTLVVALKAADLVDTLSGPGPFTVFAPTNEAFAALPAGVLTSLLLPQNKAKLIDVLTYHVVTGDVHAADLRDGEMVRTVEGKNVSVRKSHIRISLPLFNIAPSIVICDVFY